MILTSFILSSLSNTSDLIIPTPLNLKNSISEYDYTINAPINSNDFCDCMTSICFMEVNIWKKILYYF